MCLKCEPSADQVVDVLHALAVLKVGGGALEVRGGLVDACQERARSELGGVAAQRVGELLWAVSEIGRELPGRYQPPGSPTQVVVMGLGCPEFAPVSLNY